MARYRLMEKDNMGNKIGPHSCGKVVRGRFTEHYLPGQIVESDMPLDKLFRGKFERVSDSNAPVSKPEIVKQGKAKGKRR